MSGLFSNLKINLKISLLGSGAVIFTAIALVGFAVWQTDKYHQIAYAEVEQLINADLDHITQGVYNLVQTEDQAVQEQINYDINVASQILSKAGALDFSEEKVTWNAINQLTGNSQKIELPKFLIAGQWIGQNSDPDIRTPIVDDIVDMIGQSATIFQRVNEDGDMLRIATTVQSDNGDRAIGTFIPAVEPDGSKNAVITSILNGNSYSGRAFVVNTWYLTSYKPIYDNRGVLVGMLYVGIDLKTLENRVREAILQTDVGESGYVFVIRGTGEDRGHYIISKDGLRDGEDIWESQDYDGNYFIQEMINKAVNLKPGEMTTIRYPWINLDETQPRWKISRVTYYKPWDWVIGTSAYEDELAKYKEVLYTGRNKMTTFMGIAGIVITLVIGLLCSFFAWTISHPIKTLTTAVETITENNLDKMVDIRSNDEIGILAKSFNKMFAKLRESLAVIKLNEARYRSLIENSNDITTVLDISGFVKYQSPSIERLLGYKRNELSGKKSLSIFILRTRSISRKNFLI